MGKKGQPIAAGGRPITWVGFFRGFDRFHQHFFYPVLIPQGSLSGFSRYQMVKALQAVGLDLVL